MRDLDGNGWEGVMLSAFEPGDQLLRSGDADLDDGRPYAGRPRCLRRAEVGVIDPNDRDIQRNLHAGLAASHHRADRKDVVGRGQRGRRRGQGQQFFHVRYREP